MAPSRRRSNAAARLALAVLACAGPPVAARAAVTAQLEPGYANGTTTTRDETGRETRTDTEQWLQRYRLSFDNQIYPLLTLSGGGSLNWDMASITSPDVPTLDADSRVWNAFARLAAGDRILNGAFDYARRWEEGETRQGGVTTESPGFVRETVSGSLGWRPADLPALSLRLSRSNAYDDARRLTDQTSDEALFTAQYQPTKDLDLRYALRYAGATDHLTDVVRTEVANSAAVTWTARYLAGRGNVYVGYNVSARTADTRAPAGAAVAIRRLPVAGLSIVETFPATPLRVTLNPNAALVDGDTAASAGVNLGTSAGAGPVIAFRDLGAQFADVVTPVNAIHVYLDRTLPPALAGAFTWDAYRSDDNVDWTAVAASGPPVYNPVLSRFEVAIERTSARYLKVVTRPLPAAATPDPQYREVFVTELQLEDVVSADQVRGRTSDLGGNLSATTRILLVQGLGLAYDFSGALSHSDERRAFWSVVNGLSLSRRLDPVFAVAGRVERADSDAGRGWEAQNRWSASLAADPLPTLGAILSYSGQLSQLEGGTAVSNTGTLSARADLYEGIALAGNGSVGWSRSEEGVTARSLLASASASIVPNRMVSLTGSASTSDTEQSGGGRPDRRDRRSFLEAGISLSPFPALALSGAVTRQFGGEKPPVTLASFTGALSPFPGGDLQLRYAYVETFDSSADLRTRSHGPSARWNIRPGWYLAAGYTLRDSDAPAATERARTFNANLLITLR